MSADAYTLEDLRAAYASGVRSYAIWRDGEQLVGCMEKPIRLVLQEVEHGRHDVSITTEVAVWRDRRGES